MDRRDEFAKAAITGFTCACDRSIGSILWTGSSKEIVTASVKIADALIAELDLTRPIPSVVHLRENEPENPWRGHPPPWRVWAHQIRDAAGLLVCSEFGNRTQAQAVIDAMGMG